MIYNDYIIMKLIIWTGGAQDIAPFTGNRYTQAFIGNIKDIRSVHEHKHLHSIDINANAVDGYRIHNCL